MIYNPKIEIPFDEILKKKVIKKYHRNRTLLKKKSNKKSVGFVPKLDLFSVLSKTRLRSEFPKNIIKKVEERLLNLPKNTFNIKILDKKYWWRGTDNELPTCTIDLPIIKVINPNWETINESCIVVDQDTNRILLVFIYAKDDKNISCCLDKCFKLIKLMEKYLKLKSSSFYGGYGVKLQPGFDSKEDKSIVLKKIGEYHGKNFLEGMQNYFLRTIGRRVMAYYHKDPESMNDDEYLEGVLWLYSCLYELEKRHCPNLGQYRYDLVKDLKNYPGCFPGVPIEMNPSTCMGGSINFSSDTHNDSSTVGTTETIIWRPDKSNLKPYIFHNSLSKLYFDINDDCMIYQVGVDPHGTLNTGDHGGVGFVNLSKKNVCNKSKLSKKWYKLWNEYLKKQ